MKKILILLTTMTLLLSACGSETPVEETPDPDVVATVAAEKYSPILTAWG